MECLILVTAMHLAHKVLAVTHASVSLDSPEMDLLVRVCCEVVRSDYIIGNWKTKAAIN